MILSRPSETDSLASGGTMKSSMAWSGSAPGILPVVAAAAGGRGDHLGGKSQGVGHLAVGAADDLGQVVRGDRVARRAPDELLDPRLGVRARCASVRTNWAGSVISPDGPDRDLDLLAVGGGDVDELFILAGPVPDLEGLGQPHDFLDQRQLEVKPWLGAAGDGLAELQEHGQLALVDRVEDGLGQGDGQDQEPPRSGSAILGGGSSAGLSLRIEVQERQELLEIAIDDRLVLHALKDVLHGLEVEPLAGDLGCTLVGVILGQEGLDLALASARRREA